MGCSAARSTPERTLLVADSYRVQGRCGRGQKPQSVWVIFLFLDTIPIECHLRKSTTGVEDPACIRYLSDAKPKNQYF
jgi:hypothetical protein